MQVTIRMQEHTEGCPVEPAFPLAERLAGIDSEYEILDTIGGLGGGGGWGKMGNEFPG